MATIQLKGLTKQFAAAPNGRDSKGPPANKKDAARKNAVDNLDLFIEDGEFLVLVGPSGCGKTTTLRMIAGLESCDQGKVTIGNRDVTHLSPSKREVAMVFQNYALYPHMTVYKNMAFGLEVKYGRGVFDVLRRLLRPSTMTQEKAKIRDEQRRGIESKVRETAEMLGIESLLSRRPHQLSGGERQRVALGRAIVRDPAAFLFDEPLSNLDAKLRAKMRLELSQLHRRLKTTCVYVTHDQTEAMSLGDRIAVMDRGKILQIGKPIDVYNQPNCTFVASFIGTNPMNLANFRWEAGNGLGHQNNKKASIWLQCRPNRGKQVLLFEENAGTSHQNECEAANCVDDSITNSPTAHLTVPDTPPGLNRLLAESLETGRQSGGNKTEAENATEMAGSQNGPSNQETSRLLTIGVRPEHLMVCPPGEGIWEGEIKGVDNLGDHSILHIQLATSDQTTAGSRTEDGSDGAPNGGLNNTKQETENQGDANWWIVRSPTTEHQVGASIGLKTEGDKLHFFDALTGQNLRDG